MNPEYVARRREILARMLRALDESDVDGYAEAYDALIALEREAGEFDGYEPGVCRVCGCTDLFGCDEGCEWADAEHTLCSNCVDTAPEGVGVDV